jgi:hypothetical protein
MRDDMLNMPPAARKLRREFAGVVTQVAAASGQAEHAGDGAGWESGVGFFLGFTSVLQ